MLKKSKLLLCLHAKIKAVIGMELEQDEQNQQMQINGLEIKELLKKMNDAVSTSRKATK